MSNRQRRQKIYRKCPKIKDFAACRFFDRLEKNHMNNERKKIINEIFTDLYRTYLEYIDITNERTPECEDRWEEMFEHMDTIRQKMQSKLLTQRDEMVLAKMQWMMMHVLEVESAYEAEKERQSA